MNIIWTDIKLVPEALRLIEAAPVRLIGPGAPDAAPGDPLRGIEEADAALSRARVAWNAGLFARAPRLKAVARSGIGVDNVALAEATAAGVCVINTPEAPTEATAEFTLALMLAAARRLCWADRRIRREGWFDSTEASGIELAGRTLGLVGFGRIGRRVAEIARALRMAVIACDPALDAETARRNGAELVPGLRELLPRADVVSLHLPLTEATRGLIGEREIGWMKPGAILINAARGPVLVESALAEALRSGRIAAAGLDVWNPEPCAAGNPLHGFDQVVAAPHIAGATEEARRGGNVGAARGVLEVLQGRRPASLVNPEVWDRRRR